MKVVGAFLISLLLLGVSSKEESEKHGNPIHEEHYKDGDHDEKYDHEAVLGSEDEAEEFSHLSPEEAKEKLGELVVKMDANNDGSVDMQELVQWILQSFTKLNLEDTKNKMKADDRDKDGFVTWDEFTESTYGMSEEEINDFQKSDEKNPDSKTKSKSLVYDKKKFAAADENGDGKLDIEEASAFLHPYDYKRMVDVETDRILAEYDTNGDGNVDEKEYTSNPSFSEKSDEDMIGEKENFKYNDENGDGSLNREEIMKWISPDLERVAKEEAEHLMSETDQNKDGQSSADEIKEQHELWVGSEATDYGDLLDHDEL